MKGAALVSCFISSLLTIPAVAQVERSSGGWACFDSMHDLLNYQTDGTVRLNNISLREGRDVMFDVPQITFKASIANRSDTDIVASVELVGSSGNSSLFALSAEPLMGTVRAG